MFAFLILLKELRHSTVSRQPALRLAPARTISEDGARELDAICLESYAPKRRLASACLVAPKGRDHLALAIMVRQWNSPLRVHVLHIVCHYLPLSLTILSIPVGLFG